MQKFTALFIFILSGCGSSVVSMSRGETREADSDTIIADSSPAAEASVTEQDVPVVAQDAPVVAQDANVENDSGTIVVDASVEPDVIIAEEDAALAEDVAAEDATPETGVDVVMEAETDASIGDTGVDAGLECHPDPRYAAPVTIAWGDGSERPNLFYLTIEVPAGWVPVTLQINLPIRQNNGTFIPATARFDVRDSGLRCAVLMGQRIYLRVPLDFGDRPANGRYVNYVLDTRSATEPERMERFAFERSAGMVIPYVFSRDYSGSHPIWDLRRVLIIGADGRYELAILLSLRSSDSSTPYGVHPSTSSPLVATRTVIENLAYQHEIPIRALVEEVEMSLCLPQCVIGRMDDARNGESHVGAGGFVEYASQYSPTLFNIRYDVVSVIDGSRGTRRAVEYHSATGRCEEFGHVEIYGGTTGSMSAPFEFIPITVSPATEPECFIHILGLVCPPGQPLLADGRCGPPRTS